MRQPWGVGLAFILALALHLVLVWYLPPLTVPEQTEPVQLLSLQWAEEAPLTPVSSSPVMPVTPSAPVPVRQQHPTPAPTLKKPPTPHLVAEKKTPSLPTMAAPVVADASVASSAPATSSASVPAPQPSAAQTVTARAEADYLNNPKPSYPRVSKRMGEQGVVRLRVEVAADGSVIQLQLAQSSGFDRLDEAAQRAVKYWKFKPAMQGSQAIRSWVEIPVKFVLEDTE